MKQFLLIILLLLPMSVSAKPLHIVSEAFPPYFAPHLPQNGWLWQVVHAAFASQAQESELEFTSWPRAMNSAKLAKVDALLGAYYTDARGKDFYYSQPLAFAHAGLLSLASNQQIQFDGDLQQLRSKIIAKGEDYAVSPDFDQASYLSVSTTNSLRKNLYLLLAQRVDVVAGTFEVARYWLQNGAEFQPLGGEQSVKFMMPELARNDLYMIFPREDALGEAKRNQFNRGIETIASNGQMQAILMQNGFTAKRAKAMVNFVKRSAAEHRNKPTKLMRTD